MLLTTRQERPKVAPRDDGAPKMPSPGLEWLWQQLRDVKHPHLLDCGPLRQATLDVYLRRKAKIFIADLVSPAQKGNPKYWDKSKKVPVFLTDDFLAQLPGIPEASLSAVFCWHLLDVIPPAAIVPVTERLFSLLQTGGVLFLLLRQPYLPAGAESACWLEDLTGMRTEQNGNKPFPHPVITNRDMERMFPAGSVKIFLTRSGRREVVAMK
jgi:hypothetical protein